MLRLVRGLVLCSLISASVFACGGNSDSEVDVIVFESDRDGDSEIFLMNPDGSNVRQLTSNDNFDGLPTWSPDGKKIYFVSDRDGSLQIFAMNPDGFDVQQITYDVKKEPYFGYSWSTDGKTIGYWDQPGGRNTFMVIEPDGTLILNSSTLEIEEQIEELDTSVYWADELSPDGSEKYFANDDDGDYEIFVSEVDGSNVRQLTNNNHHDQYPRLSPDGKKIVFYSDRYGDNEIFVMETNGANLISTTQQGKLASFKP